MFMRCSRALHTISPPSHHLRRRKESQERECLADAPSPAARNLFTHPPAEVKVANGKGRGQKRKAAPSYVCKVWRKRFSRPNIELSINCSITVKRKRCVHNRWGKRRSEVTCRGLQHPGAMGRRGEDCDGGKGGASEKEN